MTFAYSSWNDPCADCRPTGSVASAGSVVTTNGSRKLFQVVMKVKIPTAVSTGPDIGMMIVRNVRSRPAPSIAAASSYSRGIASKKFLRMNTMAGATSCGRMTAQ